MKKISQQQVEIVMNLLRACNVGVQDYINMQKMFDSLPEVETAVTKAEQTPKVAAPKVEAPKVVTPKK